MSATDYGIVSRLPESASQGATANLHGVAYVFHTGGIGWVEDKPVYSGLQDAYDNAAQKVTTKRTDIVENNGGKTSYYDVPEGAKTLNDLIEAKDMRFWQGEIFKAIYALEERASRATDGSSSEVRELNKIKYYVDRRLAQIAKGQDAKN